MQSKLRSSNGQFLINSNSNKEETLPTSTSHKGNKKMTEMANQHLYERDRDVITFDDENDGDEEEENQEDDNKGLKNNSNVLSSLS